jgi:UDP-glucuronate decarboxylase
MTRAYSTRKRVLVTGGAGFLGSHLIDRLIDRGDEVVCVDNLFTGTKHNVAHLYTEPRFEFMRHDVTFPLYVEVDEIYNLACPASPIHYQHDPVQTTKTSVHGAINMLGLAKRLRCRIFQASTSEIYGSPTQHPQQESYWGNVNPIGPRSCYDESKRCAETLFFDYHRQHGLDIKVARIFNCYGPRMHPNDGRVVSSFIMQALADDPITINGDGKQTRSFCYVDDLIEGFLRFMDTENGFTGPINLGNPVEFTMNDLAAKVIELTGSRSEIVYKPLPVDDPLQRRPDITIASSKLGWSPAIQLEEGLHKTIAYFKALRRTQKALVCATGQRLDEPLTPAEISDVISRTLQKHTPVHPEARWLQPYCKGLSVDIGCGFEKVAPDVLGIDKLAYGQSGGSGCMVGRASCADIQADANDLYFVADGTFDSAVSRHVFEHLPDPKATIKEWLRIVKPGGTLALVLPNDHWGDFLNMDSDHKFRCYPETVEEALRAVNGQAGSVRGELVENGRAVVENWSFFALLRRV